MNSGTRRHGRLVILSAPSGSGKTTVLGELIKRDRLCARSVSATTRPPRPGEVEGRDYHFLSRERFRRMRASAGFLEHAAILGHWYGTPRAPVERAIRAGRDVLLGIDVQGARALRHGKLPLVTIFLLPPSLGVLSRRLRGRGTETPAQIRARLRLARREMKEVRRYDYAVVNDRLEEAVKSVLAILRTERCRVRGGKW
ncbi:MAG: guanylate kinase [Candidatus Omnitrophica bacterium]|nr:guanylate kinase [Candidatus Omnitrophota bacterium]